MSVRKCVSVCFASYLTDAAKDVRTRAKANIASSCEMAKSAKATNNNNNTGSRGSIRLL